MYPVISLMNSDHSYQVEYLYKYPKKTEKILDNFKLTKIMALKKKPMLKINILIC